MSVDYIRKHARYIMNYSRFKSLIALLLIVATAPGALAAERPNIIWIIAEDMSCDFGYQGQPLVHTHHVDRLAKEGVAFSNAYVSSPVCSPCRSALITGMYQTSIGVQNHYTGRGTVKHHLPDHVRPIPELFKEAGYYTCNANQGFKNFGKTDYDFEYDRKALYDGPDWSGRKQGQPFFAQIQLRGGKFRRTDLRLSPLGDSGLKLA